jgi:hypothetical protein
MRRVGGLRIRAPGTRHSVFVSPKIPGSCASRTHHLLLHRGYRLTAFGPILPRWASEFYRDAAKKTVVPACGHTPGSYNIAAA